MYTKLHTGAQTHRKCKLALTIQKQIATLHERFRNQEIDAEQLLNSLSLLVGKKQ
jgi:hypothetical protein